MVSAAAIALSGLPPFGLGVYARDSIEPAPAWAFVAVNGFRSDAAEQVAQVRARGAHAWLYGTPDHFRPEGVSLAPGHTTWRAGLASLAHLASSLPVAGIIADGEGGWPDLTAAARATQGAAFGAELGRLSEGTRVGFTSYPSFPALAELAAAAGRGVWGSPQIYGRTSQDAETFRAWFAAWRQHFGARVIPSIAGWAAQPSMGTPEGFRAYLSKLPHAAGAIVWDGAGAMPGYIADSLAAYSPGGSEAGTASEIARVLAQHPPLMIAVIVVAVVVAALAIGVK